MRIYILICLLILLTAIVVQASGELNVLQALPVDTEICPTIISSSGTDDPQPDTLSYNDGVGGWILNGPTNLWSSTRFTPANDFEVRAVYIQVANPQNASSRWYAYVMSSNAAGAPTGVPLAEAEMPMMPVSNTWEYAEFDSYVTFTGGEEFHIIYGPAPSGSYPTGGGFWPAMDDAPTGSRNHYATGATIPTAWTTNNYGDYMVMAGGEYAPGFTDIQAVNAFTSDRLYWNLPNNEITFKATVQNVGFMDVQSFAAQWDVFSEGVSIWASAVLEGPITAGQTISFNADENWWAATPGIYEIRLYVNAPDDINATNDTTWLELYVTDLNDMPYTYAHEELTGNTTTDMWGISFNLPESPAHIDSIEVYIPYGGNSTVAVLLNDGFSGGPNTEVWTTTVTADSGWNTFYPDNLNVFEDMFTITYTGDSPLSSTSTGINSANNDSMMTSAWSQSGANWEKFYSGDWPFTVYLDTTSAIPPEPVIAANADTIDFGTVTVGTTEYFDLTVYNLGGQDDLILNAMLTNPPAGIYVVEGFTPGTHVAAGDSITYQVAFSPAAVQSYPNLLGIMNNATTIPFIIPLFGEGIAGIGVMINLTPENPPITIPAGGGSFQFDLEITNNDIIAYTIDIWTDIALPGGGYYPIVIRENINFASGASIIRPDLTQFVPGTAAGGAYSYNGYVRDHNTWELLSSDSFDFDKLGFDGSSNHNLGWSLLGWEDNDIISAGLPSEFALNPAYPNPFNPETTLSFSLPQAGDISLVIYDVTGREIVRLADGFHQAGIHTAVFSGNSLSSGIYFARLEAANLVLTEKLVLLK